MSLCKMSMPNLCYPGLLRQGLRVLVVDGSLDSRELLLLVFAQYGVEAITAASASEAVEIIQRFPIDLVISELVLPGEDGYSLIRKLKALQVHIPVIALTVFTSNDDRRRALSVGFCKHLPKPLDLDRLIETVASVTQWVQTEKAATV